MTFSGHDDSTITIVLGLLLLLLLYRQKNRQTDRSHHLGEATVKTAIQLRFDFDSTAVRLLVEDH